MKPPRFAVWMFHQLGACAGDQLVDGARCESVACCTAEDGNVDGERVA